MVDHRDLSAHLRSLSEEIEAVALHPAPNRLVRTPPGPAPPRPRTGLIRRAGRGPTYSCSKEAVGPLGPQAARQHGPWTGGTPPFCLAIVIVMWPGRMANPGRNTVSSPLFSPWITNGPGD
jgi:hypothetical protein